MRIMLYVYVFYFRRWSEYRSVLLYLNNSRARVYGGCSRCRRVGLFGQFFFLYNIFIFLPFPGNRLKAIKPKNKLSNQIFSPSLRTWRESARALKRVLLCVCFFWYMGRASDRWMTCDFTSCSTVFQSYQHDGRLIMKGCAQWSSVYG